MNAEPILARLEGVRERAPDRWTARCPAHEDKKPSLSIRDAGDRLLVYCFGGCNVREVVEAIGLRFDDLFADRQIRRTYDSQRPRIPAGERLELLEHEIGVAFFIASDFLTSKTITDEAHERLTKALQRIGSARHA